MLEAIWLYGKNMQNLENLYVFEILITQKLLKCPPEWLFCKIRAQILSYLIASQSCRTRQNNSKSSILPKLFFKYVTNINNILCYQTGRAFDTRIL